MDPFTHSLLGIACAIALTRDKAYRRPAALAGLAAGLLPDADIFLRSATDPLFNLHYHRHFTHSLLFSPVIALLAACIAKGLYAIFRGKPPWLPLLWAGWIAGLSHIFCDVWTSYGTRAWWPFSDDRVSLDWISVIDPLFTIPLAPCVALALWYASRRSASVGLAWCALYLGFCVVQQQRAAAGMREWMAAKGLPAPERSTVKPSFGNVIVWRCLMVHDGVCRVIAVRCGLPGNVTWTEGGSQPIIPSAGQAARDMRVPEDSTQGKDIARFYHFSDGWIGVHPDDPLVLGDLRYANLPDDLHPLWGIRVSPPFPQQHVEYRTFRQLNNASISGSMKRLLEMIVGPVAAEK